MQAGFRRAVHHRCILHPALPADVVPPVCIQFVDFAVAHVDVPGLDLHEQQVPRRRHDDDIDLAMALLPIMHAAQRHVVENFIAVGQVFLKTGQCVEFAIEAAGMAACGQCAWIQDCHAKQSENGDENMPLAGQPGYPARSIEQRSGMTTSEGD